MDAILMNTLKNIENKKAKYARMYFNYEPVGTQLYLYHHDKDAILVTKHRKRNASIVKELQVQKINVGSCTMAYIQTWRILEPDIYDIFKAGKDYIIKPSTFENRLNYARYRSEMQTGEIGCANRICLAEYNNYLFSKKALEVTVDIENGFYIELKPVNEAMYPTKGLLCKMYGTQYLRELKHFSYTLADSLHREKSMILPNGFVRTTGLKKGDVLPIYRDGDKIVIEGMQAKCAICGKSISVYKQTPDQINTCSCCHEAIAE